jgi:hypothetical protein
MKNHPQLPGTTLRLPFWSHGYFFQHRGLEDAEDVTKTTMPFLCVLQSSVLRRVVHSCSALAALCLLVPNLPLPAAPLPQLKVSDNHRFLVTENGQPFFWLGDTAWELFHRLNREEAELYLKNRAERRFTIIQAVVLAELDGLKDPNPYGHTPLTKNDPTKPNEDYFKHVDWIVAKANSLGLYIGMLPTWGNQWHKTNAIFTVENAETYGAWLGRRYKDAGLVWILGGDHPIQNETHKEVIRAMARGLRKGDGGAHLKTFHPPGEMGSARWLHDDEWLDFNMVQTGHSPESSNYGVIERDYARTPAKPCMDGEPPYEYPPNAMPTHRPVGALQVRRNAYWAVFAGAHGHTYGTHPVWQMYAPPRKPLWDVQTPWYDALDLPGAMQLSHLRALMLSRPYLSRLPDQELVVAGQGAGLGRIQATRDGTRSRNDATYLMAYFPEPRRATINTAKLAAAELRGWWLNPRTGKATALGVLPNRKTMLFEPPANVSGEDSVLVLDDAAKNYPPPGTQP